MSTRRRITEAGLERIVTMREAGRTYVQIASAIGCRPSVVEYHCLRLAADPPGPQVVHDGIVGPAVMVRGNHIVRRFTADDDNRLIALEGQGLPGNEIARRMSRQPNSIRGRLRTLARREARLEARA